MAFANLQCRVTPATISIMLFTADNRPYTRVAFDDEGEIEKVVFRNVAILFGDYTCLLPKSKIETIGGKGTIPDGVLINLQSKEWFIIEVERGIHGTWQHIAPQISRQLTAFVNDASLAKILAAALDEIKHNRELRDLLLEIGIQEIAIHGELDAILQKPPVIALPIDDIPTDLEDWTKTLKNDVRIWRIEKYIGESNEVMYSIPDADEEGALPDNVVGPAGAVGGKTSIMNAVVKAGLLKPGETVHFDYGPKGKPKTHFEGIIREDGIEIDEKVYSPSVAALKCIKKTGSTRKSANGWVVWRTEDGALINDAYNRLSAPG